ncbi:MAG: hypothetical protein RI922_1837 [Bacteroidota bacterium]|jgi:hypothetical protein
MKKETIDEKQMTLILSWHQQAQDSTNEYLKFMSNWIAFNAICYALYYKSAIKERADIDRKKSKIDMVTNRLMTENNLVADKASIEKKDEKWMINLELPERLFLTIQKTYTEDIIYTLFDSEWSIFFDNQEIFNELSLNLKRKIEKDGFHYIINMARVFKFDSKNIPEMIKRNIIIPLDEIQFPQVRKVLYQIRNNIFHGEKTPGEPNDDRIVKAANPVLNEIVSFCIQKLKIR